jgi:pimeloyl-ACP methyl ester carboxylesterase/tRNA A-37 threonylcarbamoyl transferase component Bud32
MQSSEQQIRFCTSSDGVSLAYATVGEGPPLVKAANWLNHLEYDWNTPVWRHWISELSRDHKLIRYDERGCGLSDWNVQDFSLDAWVNDLESVVEANKLDRFPLLGISQGGPIAITYTARHPEKVTQLILYGSYALGLKRRKFSQKELEEADVFLQLIRVGWGKEHPAFRQVFTSLFMPEATPEQAGWFNKLQRVSSSPENAARMLAAFFEIDVTELAQKLTVPTLVLHAEGDLRIPFAEGRRLAALIPNSRFVPLESRNHILLKTEPAWRRFLTEVRSFLGVAERVEPETLLRTTVGSKTSKHTDSRWNEISSLFARAAGVSGSDRENVLGEISDAELRHEVETLLEQDDAGSLLPQLDDMVRGSVIAFGESSDDLAGRRISHYRVLQKLGEGGMGTVYKAHDDWLDRYVALKFLPKYFSARKDLKHRFVLEAKAAAALDHPNICTIYEIGESADGQLYISMACYEGETVKEKIARGPLPVQDALSYVTQAAEGLGQAHAAGIVHRDIKPANLFVTTRGQLKILDFGVAKVEQVDLTGSGVLIGTMAYMSPEQADGAVIDHRTDMWSLGVVLYEMLAGRHPFGGELDQPSLSAIRELDPPELAVPTEVQTIVKRLLAKKPDSRYPAVEDLLQELRTRI